MNKQAILEKFLHKTRGWNKFDRDNAYSVLEQILSAQPEESEICPDCGEVLRWVSGEMLCTNTYVGGGNCPPEPAMPEESLTDEQVDADCEAWAFDELKKHHREHHSTEYENQIAKGKIKEFLASTPQKFTTEEQIAIEYCYRWLDQGGE